MDGFEIEVDAREKEARLARALAARGDVRLRVRWLRAGDYAVAPSRVGIESKTAADLARSIVDGRLFRQAGALARLYDRPILLLQGFSPGHPILGVSAEAIRGALVSLAAVFRIPTVVVSGPREAAEAVVTMARQQSKSFESGYVRAGWRPRGLRVRRLFVLQGLPGVGPRRASALLDRFGDLARVMSASVEELESVSLVGRGVAAAIVRVARDLG